MEGEEVGESRQTTGSTAAEKQKLSVTEQRLMDMIRRERNSDAIFKDDDVLEADDDEGEDEEEQQAPPRRMTETDEEKLRRISIEEKSRRKSEEEREKFRKSVGAMQIAREQRRAEEERIKREKLGQKRSKELRSSKAMRLLRRSIGNEDAPPDQGTLIEKTEEEQHLANIRRGRSSNLSRGVSGTSYFDDDEDDEGEEDADEDQLKSTPSYHKQRERATSLLDQLHHNLKPRDEDVLYLKRRILFPGIFDQESSSSDEEGGKPKNVRRIPMICTEVEPPEKPKLKPEDLICDTTLLLDYLDTAGDEPEISCVPVSAESSLPVRLKRPQDVSICADADPKSKASKALSKQNLENADEAEGVEGGLVVGSEMSLHEKLCLLEEESTKPMSTKERYIGHKSVAGYPKCIDKTMEHLECLPPGQVVRNAIDTQKLWGIPHGVPLSRPQFVDLIHHMEHHENNDYICLVFALPRSHPEYNPYSFRVLKHSEVGNRMHYTCSRYGALFISNGMADFISMKHIHSHMVVYDKCHAIPFFANYRVWRTLYIWHHSIIDRRQREAKEKISRDLFYTKRPLRIMLLELNKMCAKLNTMPLLTVRQPLQSSPSSQEEEEEGQVEEDEEGDEDEQVSLPKPIPFTLADFLSSQTARLETTQARFRTFDSMVIEMTGAACRAALIEEGFSPDKYPEEMEFYMKQLEIPIHLLGRNLDTSLTYPGQWLSFSQQRKKRLVCKRITEFIRLVDYLVQRAYHKLLKTSMFTLILEMQARLPFVPRQYFTDWEEEGDFMELKEKIELHYDSLSLSGYTEPMFDIGCGWNDKGVVFSPSIDDYVKGWHSIMGAWKDAILSYSNMLTISTFNPYTQPIINGSVNDKICGDGPSFQLFLDLDQDLITLANTGEQILRHSFHLSEQYISNFIPIRLFCIENEKLDLDLLRNETSVSKFQGWLEKYEEQKQVLEQVDDVEGMGIFRVNNEILRSHATPTIQRCVDVLVDVMLELGAVWVIESSTRLHKGIERITKFPKKTATQLEEFCEEFEEIEKLVDITSELFDLMDDYKIINIRDGHEIKEEIKQDEEEEENDKDKEKKKDDENESEEEDEDNNKDKYDEVLIAFKLLQPTWLILRELLEALKEKVKETLQEKLG